MKVLGAWSLLQTCTIILLSHRQLIPAEKVQTVSNHNVNPCCNYPCHNMGVCVRSGLSGYDCDCTRTGYSGENCTIPRSNLIPSPPTYNSKYGYLNWEAYYNHTYYTRILPPVPEDCPTPMGVKGKTTLPDPKMLVQKFLRRQTFNPDPQGTNLMFAFFAQHFTHQFFKTHNRMGVAFTKALGHGVDAGHIYGDNLARQLNLRLLKDGKLKYQLVMGDMYPPTDAYAKVNMSYPPAMPPEHRMAIGQEVFGLLPGLSMYATLWLREHNRICDVLIKEHPTWDDEQLFQTARLIVIGETIRIVIEDYVQHLSGYLLQLKFDPELLFNSQFQYQNRISLEFNHLYHWHALMPDSFIIDGDDVPYSQFIFNTSLVTHYGIEKLVDAFSRQQAGQIGGGKNIHPVIIGVAEDVIRESRELRVQPFNEYRKRFNLKPYESFLQLTENEEMAQELEEMYGDIDALEFYPGLLLEKTRPGAIFGESMVEMGAPFSLKGLMGNPICSPEYWKPSTFGGQTGFNLVNSATLERLVCLNTKWCPYVAFRVPYESQREEKSSFSKNEL
ncbi:prostaglandin G/H synthase 1 isoform X2 [Engraulis encrasicolus]|uniref:prostaglandin G/H synthase 1 isoform X2 n=1 Tax=Engraulis encrasicolus TaxID=184585 RepID=UPI002FD64209